ncbi:MAG: glycosyl hydrolase family 28 protein, partial [Planctomycetota bacterium]
MNSYPITPNDFTGSDSERINQAVSEGAKSGRRVLIPRCNQREGEVLTTWHLDTAILVPGDTTLELQDCHLKLSDRCRDNFIRSANCGIGISEVESLRNIHILGSGSVLLEGADHPRATGDSAKTLGERTYGTDAGVAGENQNGDWRNIGILMAYVEDFTLSGIRIKDSHCWAVSLERCAHGTIRDLSFASTEHYTIDGEAAVFLNQDGLDLRQGCHDILIDGITGYTGDDLVAFTGIAWNNNPTGGLASSMVTTGDNRGDGLDDIRNITLRSVRGH